MQLDALVRDSVSPMEAVARRKNVRLVRTVQGEPMAPLDENLVKRSLENLVSNAVKYTPAGGDVEIALRRVDGHVEIEVADRGPGVPDEQKPDMFEKFGSVEAKTGARRKGIGLGLYLVKLVAEGHEGSVAVEDRPGGGSVFRLILGAG